MNDDDKKHIEVLFLCDNLRKDIEFTKTQIWNTTYLTVLAISALVAAAFKIKQISGPVNCLHKLLFMVLIIVIGMVGIKVVNLHQNSLKRHRDGIDRIKHVSKELILLKQYSKMVDEEDESSRCFFKHLHERILIGTFVISIIIILFI